MKAPKRPPVMGGIKQTKQVKTVPPLSKGTKRVPPVTHLSHKRVTENSKRVEAMVALDQLMDHLPSIQDNPVELIKYIDHVCTRRKCNMVTTSLLRHLGVDTLGTSLEDYPPPVLLSLLGFLYEGSCVEESLTKKCETLVDKDRTSLVHVVRKFNPDAPRKPGVGEIPNYIHTLCIGFANKDSMIKMADYLYQSQSELGCKVLGFRDNPKWFRTIGDYELKAWFKPSLWREQNAWIETLSK